MPGTIDLDDLYTFLESNLREGDVDLSPYTNMEALAELLARHRYSKDMMARVEGEIVEALIPTVPFGGGTVDGVGVVQVMGGKDRKKFDQPRLLSQLAADVFLNDCVNDEGEITMTVREAVEHTANVVAAATGALTPSFTAWRSGVLKSYGRKLDDYAEEIAPSPKSIVIR